MLDAKRIESLPQIPTPVLTAYLNTNPADPRNQGSPPGCLTWLKSRGKLIGERVSAQERKELQTQLKRVENSLRNSKPSRRGVVILAGPTTWEEIPLQVDVEDELHWGLPSLTQLMWLMDEHQPCGVVLVDRSRARFFKFWLGEAEELKQKLFEIDMTEWRGDHMVPTSHPGLSRTRGSQRDVFEHRLEAQYSRLYRAAAERIRRWIERDKLVPAFIAGPSEVVERIWDELPSVSRGRALLAKGDLSHLSLADLQARIESKATRWKRARQLEHVTQLLNMKGSQRIAVGLDDTLRRLQEGKARELVIVRRLGGKLKQCIQCGWTDRSADLICATCGGERRAAALRAVLPELARRFSVAVEVVAGDAARKLRCEDGIAAWLR